MAKIIEQFDTLYGINKNKRVLLLILDGWGISPSWSGNAITLSNPKNFNLAWRNYPHTVLHAFKNSTNSIGFVGNSEIGHASIGTGRVISQDISEINDSIDQGFFFDNPELLNAFSHAKKYKSNIHFIGMISAGGIHSHINHLYALIKMAKKNNVNNLNLHLITDGIDSADRDAINYIENLNKVITEYKVGKISTIIGRYYAMDKGSHYDRIEKAYLLQTKGRGNVFSSPEEALKFYYKNNITDAYIPATFIKGNKNDLIGDYDSIVYFNFRPDRAQALTRAYLDKDYFKNFLGRKYKLKKEIYFVTLTSYMLNKIPVHVAFPTAKITNNLAGILSRSNFRQLHIAESEKCAHVTYFFNGGNVEKYKDEEWVIFDSPNVSNYDKTPKMSLEKIYKTIIKAIKINKYQFIVANFANVDMLAHTGNIEATVNAIKYTDLIIGKLLEANKDNITIITADHGNAEQIIPYKSTSNVETLHTANPVPLIIIDKNQKKNNNKNIIKNNIDVSEIIKTKNSLADVAPTILEIFNISKPNDMTGHSLLHEIGYK